jgi:alkylated DNA nucleotide flippase Atl1
MKSIKSWREKMENPKLPKLERVPAGMRRQLGAGMMLVPSPRQVDAYMRSVPEGSVVTFSGMRSALARKNAADVTCPMVVGMFVRIAAEAAEEDAAAGKAKITPWWRVVKDDGALNPKFPGGVARQAERLREEGHRIVRGGGKKPPRVALPVQVAG